MSDKRKAIVKYKVRYRRVRHIISKQDRDLAWGIFYELNTRPCGEWMTAMHKLLRKYERILGISEKGNPSK